ncbi:MAG TPA: hypothetical protein VND93_21180 [Myxococcales bacterium]|nr:hypothetical protein [Myxococcales bacterium]
MSATRASVAAVLGLSLLLVTCVEVRQVRITFGDQGEGLDGFMCRDTTGTPILSRLEDGAGQMQPAALVLDFIRLGGLPGCRSGQVMSWCSDHPCAPIAEHRACISVQFSPPDGLSRAELRASIQDALHSLGGTLLTGDAPDEFVLVRLVGTAQSCAEVERQADGTLPVFDEARLVGCVYSCPVLLDALEGDLFLGFDTLTDLCEQGVRVCAAGDLHWQPINL